MGYCHDKAIYIVAGNSEFGIYGNIDLKIMCEENFIENIVVKGNHEAVVWLMGHDKFDVLLKDKVACIHELSVRMPDIAKMPRLMGSLRNFESVCGISEYKAEIMAVARYPVI
jgi:hypothetical protein